MSSNSSRAIYVKDHFGASLFQIWTRPSKANYQDKPPNFKSYLGGVSYYIDPDLTTSLM